MFYYLVFMIAFITVLLFLMNYHSFMININLLTSYKKTETTGRREFFLAFPMFFDVFNVHLYLVNV